MNMTQKLKTTSKIVSPSQQKYYLKFFWWLLTLTATAQLVLNREFYQVSKPVMEFKLMDMINRALHIHTHTEKLYIYIGVEARDQKQPFKDFYIDTWC